MIYLKPKKGKKFAMTLTYAALRRAGRMWKKAAVSALKKLDKDGGALEDSIKYEVGQEGDTFYVDVTPQVPYWEYVEEGVQGAKRNKDPRQKNSPFKYTGRYKSVPTGPIDRWAVRKGLQGIRDAKGKFIPRKSLVFLISKSIYERGIVPAYFMRDSYEDVEAKVMAMISSAYEKDMQAYLDRETED